MIGVLNKAWKDAQEQIRIHRGKPLPGSLTHEKVKRVRAPRGLSAGMISVLASEAQADGVCQSMADAPREQQARAEHDAQQSGA